MAFDSGFDRFGIPCFPFEIKIDVYIFLADVYNCVHATKLAVCFKLRKSIRALSISLNNLLRPARLAGGPWCLSCGRKEINVISYFDSLGIIKM